jgi:hypothetical protein
MKNNKYFLNTALAAVVGVVLCVCVILRTFIPAIVLPQLSIPNMVLLSLIALLLDHHGAGETKRCWICVPVFAFLTFGLLPYGASLASIPEALKLAAVGCVTFTVTTWLFASIQDRLSSGPVAKIAPELSALGLYLASQCFAGLL